MSETSNLDQELAPLIGELVVVDIKGPYLYIGTLRKAGREVLVLADADVHLCEDTQTTSELYVLEARKNGIRPNRRVVYVMCSEVVSISRLDDVVVY